MQSNPGFDKGAQVSEERDILLGAIYETFFKGHEPNDLLYLGAGADLYNPYHATHAREYTLVDSEDNVKGLGAYVGELWKGAKVTVDDSTKGVVVWAVSDKGKPVAKVTFRQRTYQDYLGTDEPNRRYEVLFIKDSWLGDVGTAVVSPLLARLASNGIWVTNEITDAWLAPVLATIGLPNLTHNLPEQARLVSFGYSTATIYRKTQQFNGALFKALCDFYFSVKSIAKTKDPLDKDTYNLALETIDDALDELVSAAQNVQGSDQFVAAARQAATGIKNGLTKRS